MRAHTHTGSMQFGPEVRMMLHTAVDGDIHTKHRERKVKAISKRIQVMKQRAVNMTHTLTVISQPANLPGYWCGAPRNPLSLHGRVVMTAVLAGCLGFPSQHEVPHTCTQMTFRHGYKKEKFDTCIKHWQAR